MVGFFNSEMVPLSEERDSLPVGADCTLSPLLPHVEPVVSSQEPPIKRVVCSPDLPVFTITPAIEEPAAVDSSTSGDKMFQCSFCQKTFNQKNTYQNHLRSHGKEGDDPYQCNYCGKTFAVPARLTRHYRTHTGEKPYQCEYCNKSFSVKENLSVHRRIHTKERPYKCDICERAFEHSGKLHRHMRIHTGERPHKCAVCAKTFIQSGQLVIHMRTHTGEKPYVCKSCGKGFTCSKQLKVHNRTHTGEKPYACDICGKSFGYNHVLKLHQVAHYGEKVYKCTICNETFTSKKTMECHIKSHAEPAVVRVEESSGGRVPEVGESSCASTSSDKENKTERESVVRSEGHPNMKELCHYLYPGSGLNPALLAAAAEARTNYSQDNQRYHEQARAASPSTSSSSRNSSPVIMVSLPVTEPPVYLVPDPLASMHRRYTPYNCPLPPPTEYLSPVLINLPLSKPIEQDPNDPLLTPPSSNPVSPVPSSSPDPVELVTLPREVLILPPRKRSKMILKSMETEAELANVRFSSVIHYAKAS